MRGDRRGTRNVAFRNSVKIVVSLLLAAACTNGPGSAATPDTSSRLELTTFTSPAGSVLPPGSVVVVESGFSEVRFSEPPNAYTWGVLIRNSTRRLATSVRLEVEYSAGGRVRRKDEQRLDFVPPGESGWTTPPVNIFGSSGERLSIDSISFRVEGGTLAGEDNLRLDRFDPSTENWTGPAEWKSRVDLVAGDAAGELRAVMLFYDPSGHLIGGAFSGVDPQPGQSGQRLSVQLTATPEGVPDLAKVRILPTRLSQAGTPSTTSQVIDGADVGVARS